MALAIGFPSVATAGQAVEELSGYLHDSWVEAPLGGEIRDGIFRLPIDRIGYELGQGPRFWRTYPYVPALLEVTAAESLGPLVAEGRPLFGSGTVEPLPDEAEWLVALELDATASTLRFLLASHHFELRLTASSSLSLRDTGATSSRGLRDLGGSISGLAWIERFVERYRL